MIGPNDEPPSVEVWPKVFDGFYDCQQLVPCYTVILLRGGRMQLLSRIHLVLVIALLRRLLGWHPCLEYRAVSDPDSPR